MTETIRIVETRLWGDSYRDSLKEAHARRGLSVREFEAAELSAADTADRAVLALRKRTHPPAVEAPSDGGG